MGNQMQMRYLVDMVFCIDATGSMGPVINTVKEHVLNFYQDVTKKMAEKNKKISQMRIRLIAFRDYLADKDQAMLATDFFRLPEQSKEFADCVNGIKEQGGGDDPEDGLEALAFAIKSKWCQDAGAKKRQVIVVWTDASTHEIGHGRSAANYPVGMPQSFSELTEWWGDRQTPSPYISQNAKRLILFAPEEQDWNIIADNWDNIIHYPSVAGSGLREYDYNAIIDAIVNSIGG